MLSSFFTKHVQIFLSDISLSDFDILDTFRFFFSFECTCLTWIVSSTYGYGFLVYKNWNNVLPQKLWIFPQNHWIMYIWNCTDNKRKNCKKTISHFKLFLILFSILNGWKIRKLVKDTRMLKYTQTKCYSHVESLNNINYQKYYFNCSSNDKQYLLIRTCVTVIDSCYLEPLHLECYYYGDKIDKH